MSNPPLSTKELQSDISVVADDPESKCYSGGDLGAPKDLQFDGNNDDVAAQLDQEMKNDEPLPGVCSTIATTMGMIIPYGGLLSSGFNLASTSVGAGIVGLPAAFSSVGYVMACAYLVLVTMETVYSMRLLILVAEKTGHFRFETLAKNLLHPRGDVVVSIIRTVNTMGGNVAFVCTVGNLVQPILDSIDGTPDYLRSANGIRLVQTGLWAVFMLPLTFPREVNSLRYVSVFGILFIVFFSILIMIHSCTNGMKESPRPPISAFKTGNDALGGLGVFIFSYMCQINCIEVYSEMLNRSPQRFTICAIGSMSLCFMLYFLTGLFGYLDFGDNVTPSVLLMYNPIENKAILVSYIGVFFKVCASFGLVNNATRSALFPLFGWDPMTVVYWKYLIGAVSLAVIALLLGLFVPNINMVFGFTGGVCGGAVGFIMPALFTMYAGGWNAKSAGIGNYVCTYLVLFAGVVAVVFATASTIYSAAS